MGSRCFEYQIEIQETLSPDRSEWFEGMEFRVEPEGRTVLRGSVRDQAALHGLLTRLRDLNLTLISVQRIESDGTRPGRGAKESEA